ncbi:MAG TPA: transcription termination/antitermination NusG family protein [Pirellulales bacterium]|nr:transcription termination/antitermination NusG family protein [Pirellulales bacterium]
MPILTAETQCFPEGLLTGNADPAVTDTAPERRWWVAHTKARQEKSLARDLLSHQIPFYLPQVEKTSIVRGRKRTAFVPLFTSYLFLYGDELERYTSLTTNRIAQLLPVKNGSELTHELLQISRLIEFKAPLTLESRLKRGDRVRVVRGSLEGVEGTVVSRRRKCRLVVAVNLIQQGVSVEIDDYLLEKI